MRLFVNAVASGEIKLELHKDLSDLTGQLKQIKGIGDWTAHYIAMRGIGDPNAFPTSDLGIIKAMRLLNENITIKEIETHAHQWQPWRAYAAIMLWNSLAEE